ncbi:MAG: hypothetical protein J6Y54_07695 [Lentisphaeria bacterium]|nr:hypothetical protein [Lentisphaeria bacterium]
MYIEIFHEIDPSTARHVLSKPLLRARGGAGGAFADVDHQEKNGAPGKTSSPRIPDLNEGRPVHGPGEDNIRPILCDFKADFAAAGRVRSAEKYEKS